MTSVLYLCGGCNCLQSIPCAAAEVEHVRGAWLVLCVCPDCGTPTSTRTDAEMAAAVLYWQHADRAVAGLRAAVAGPDVVAAAEQIVKEHARE